jgi:hypothetical protein
MVDPKKHHGFLAENHGSRYPAKMGMESADVEAVPSVWFFCAPFGFPKAPGLHKNHVYIYIHSLSLVYNLQKDKYFFLSHQNLGIAILKWTINGI